MQYQAFYFWKQVPFFRLLVPFIAGILLQWYYPLSAALSLCIVMAACLFLGSFYLLREPVKFQLRWLQGVCIQLIFFVAGALITWHHDIRHHSLWVGKHYKDSSIVLVTVKEPLVEKEKSYKALASVNAIKVNGTWQNVKGDILLYFRKDSTRPKLEYGAEIVFTRPLQKITNSGNPGAFDYQRFCAFQDIYHQAYLKKNDYVITGSNNGNFFRRGLFNTRNLVINVLKEYIYDEREEGVAEALLIGYRDDLDKSLVQAYSNTGVVHIIAISGLHLGMIYAVLAWTFNRFKKRKWISWVKPLVILGVLWIFSLLAGAVPSILRSAVMFTCIVLGEAINRKGSVYNTLAVSAFVMLCYNPYFLWDAGFQLSYAAVLSIVVFMSPIYNWFYIKNKLLDGIWQLNAVTLSAQVLTLPFVLYHFHQFPNLFLITNFVVVPLSSIILFAELALILFSKIILFGQWIGIATSGMLRFMNNFIQRMDGYPFSVTDNIRLNLFQAILLSLFLMAAAYWMMRKSKPALYVTLSAFLVFTGLRHIDTLIAEHQQKVIVYNVPQHTAMDFIDGKRFLFVGDSSVSEAGFLRDFHLKGARIGLGVSAAENKHEFEATYPFYLAKGKRILLYDQAFQFQAAKKIPVDVIVVAKNQRVKIDQLARVFACKQYVFDGSNFPWKIRQWKKECDSLHLPHYCTTEQGAFELDL